MDKRCTCIWMCEQFNIENSFSFDFSLFVNLTYTHFGSHFLFETLITKSSLTRDVTFKEKWVSRNNLLFLLFFLQRFLISYSCHRLWELTEIWHSVVENVGYNLTEVFNFYLRKTNFYLRLQTLDGFLDGEINSKLIFPIFN